MTDDLCAWCRHPRAEHGPPGQSPLGRPDDRLCPVPGVSSQFFAPLPRRTPPASAPTGFPARGHLYREIEDERRAQDCLWGGPAHDDAHGPRDWVALCRRHLGLAVDDADGHDPGRWRKQMLRVAALALAAVESQDRLAGREPTAGPVVTGSGF